MTMPSYPTDRASIVSRGLVNLQGQVKSVQSELEWTKRTLAYLEENPLHAKRIPEHLLRIINLEDVLRVLMLYIELGEQEARRLSKQPSLFAESEASA